MELDALWHKVIVSKYDPHLFEWVIGGGAKWPSKNLWKAITFGLPSFIPLVKCSVGEGLKCFYFWEDCWVGHKLL